LKQSKDVNLVVDGLKILTAMIPKSKEEAAEDELRRLSADGK